MFFLFLPVRFHRHISTVACSSNSLPALHAFTCIKTNSMNTCYCTRTDARILQLIRERHEEAFNLLYKHYWKPLYSYAFSLVDDEFAAEEIVQQLMVAFFANRPAIRNTYGLYPYLLRAVRNRSINHLRDQNTRRRNLSAVGTGRPYVGESISGRLEWHDMLKAITTCLGRLPHKYSEVFFLHRVEQLTVREIAQLLNRPATTVEKQLSKAVHLVRNSLTSDQQDQ